MAISLDVRRVFRSSSFAKNPEKSGTIHFQEAENTKARHILGLDSTCINATGRSSSACSATTGKVRGVTFSDATTAVTSIRSTAEDLDETYASKLKRKGSAILVKKNKAADLPANSLRPQVSDSSLHSFYDRTRAPLSVSQQTSDSSSRDFALRRGAPSIMSTSSQEKEHSKQIRLITTRSKSNADRRKQIISTTISRASSVRSPGSSVVEHNSLNEGLESTQPSASRISIIRVPVPPSNEPPISKRRSFIQEYPEHMVKTPMDPAQAKINVRRPKAGSRNWFDSIDDDSSEDEKGCCEPRLETDFTVEVKDIPGLGQNDTFPSRTSSRVPKPADKPTNQQLKRSVNRYDVQEALQAAEAYELPSRKSRRKKHNPFEVADLTKQSLLWLSSSENSDNDSEQEGLRIRKTKIRESLVNAPWDDSEIVVGKATKLGTKSPEVVMKNIRAHGIESQVPKRKGSKLKLETYLDDSSTTTTVAQHDLLTSFPETPETFREAPSLRESMLSETESMRSTKLITVTRQEETLIAAMRMKRIAMRKAQLDDDRTGTLRRLEQNADGDKDNASMAPSNLQQLQLQHLRPHSAALSKPQSAARNPRQDSVTTIQTDSIMGQSVRSSIATYLSEGSEDLQLPYSSIYGLPMGSSVLRPSPSRNRRSAPRDTFLSEATIDSTIAPASEERLASTASSHIVLLDPIEHRLLRDEIPSQLFLESPYLGWSIQASH